MSEGKVKMIGKNLMTSFPYTIYMSSLLAWIVSGEEKYGFFMLIAIVFGDVFNVIEKKISKKIMSSNSKIGMRPSGCGNLYKKKCTGCGIYQSNGISNTWGMPSGHAQITSLSATYWIMYVWLLYKNEKEPENKSRLKTKAIISTIIMVLIVIIVCVQRVYSGCHTVLQVIVGSVIGVILGVFGYYISTKVIKTVPKIN
jgi:membrane-associated phospholipid phosphatase